jgi:arsenite methyltransferase
MNQIHELVRERYADAARQAGSAEQASCCSTSCCGDAATPAAEAAMGSLLYSDAERAELPDAAVLASLGCGNPIAVAELRPGEVVLDLGSGGGIDVLLSGRRVGPEGRAIGLDMTDEMLALARRNAAEAGATNVEFIKGHIEAIPLPDASVDVVISNCVINLAADKAAVLGEIARVLRPGGRAGISDIVAEDHMTEAQRAERGSYVGCIAGALSFAEYRAGLAGVGLAEVSITPTHAVADGMHSAIIRAVKPA